MQKAIRFQGDGQEEEYSELTGLDMTESTVRTRQEFKDEANLNILLKRFGINVPQKQPTFGEVDFDLDFQQALGAISEIKSAWRDIPTTLRQKYQNWQNLLDAMENGTVKPADLKPAEQPETPPAEPPKAA